MCLFYFCSLLAFVIVVAAVVCVCACASRMHERACVRACVPLYVCVCAIKKTIIIKQQHQQHDKKVVKEGEKEPIE